MNNGVVKKDRTGVGTISTFGRQIRFDLQQGFPLLTTKKIHWVSVVHELLWFLRGDTNINYLKQHGVRIWNEWADEDGNLGPVYGQQWRGWPLPDGNHVDQIQQLIEDIRHNPDSRRLIVSAWNVGQLPQMRLWPCHVLFQCYVVDGVLSGQLYQRSADLFLGVPFNIASYALLLHLLAAVTGLKVGEFVHSFGDLHLYNNHRQQAETQLTRCPLPLPTLTIKPLTDINAVTTDDILLTDYRHHNPISAEIAV